MTRFKSKPVEIEATQFRGVHDSDIEAFAQGAITRVWLMDEPDSVHPVVAEFRVEGGEEAYEIDTLEGTMLCRKGDWLIKGTEGEFYPCKDSVFQRKYEPA